MKMMRPRGGGLMGISVRLRAGGHFPAERQQLRFWPRPTPKYNTMIDTVADTAAIHLEPFLLRLAGGLQEACNRSGYSPQEWWPFAVDRHCWPLVGFDSPWEEGLGLLDFIGHRQEGTGQWFLDAPEFRKWLHTLKETLFCPGIPGAGKTMTAAVAIDHLWNNHLFKAAPGDAVGVAYVYCNYKTQSNQNAAALLAALIRQLVQARPSITEPVESLHEKHSKKEPNHPLNKSSDYCNLCLQTTQACTLWSTL